MVKKELFVTRADGINLYRNYSDQGYMIQKVGTDEVYAEAIDIEGAPYEYEETAEKIVTEPPEVETEEIIETEDDPRYSPKN